MIGRIAPGRLPSTEADLTLIDQRIAFNKQQLSLLTQKQQKGLISAEDAGYRRLFLEGEIEQLVQFKLSRRISTPSYKPLQFKTTKPANKMISDSRDDGLPAGYFGDDEGRNGGSIPSDWNENIQDNFKVPEIPGPVIPPQGNWPSHWPGNHSPAIEQLLVDASKVGSTRIVFAEKTPLKVRGDLINNDTDFANAIQVAAQYEKLLEIVSTNPVFTTGDRRLVSQILNDLNQKITAAKMAKQSPQKPPQLPPQRPPQRPQKPPQLPPQRPQKPERPMPMPMPPQMPPHMMPIQGRQTNQRGFKASKRIGQVMGLGAMQAHDRFNNMRADRGITPYQDASFNQTVREMTMARARAGAQIDVNQQIKDEPVTRPWQLQVTLSQQQMMNVTNMLNTRLDAMGLSQEMFTQQAHNYLAQLVNSLDSSMNPNQQTEIVVETFLTHMVNRSALFKNDLKVDIQQNGESPITFSPAESISGVVGSLSKTRNAMSRLLG